MKLVGSTHLGINMTPEKKFEDRSFKAHSPSSSPEFQLPDLGNGETWVGSPALPAQTVPPFGLVCEKKNQVPLLSTHISLS